MQLTRFLHSEINLIYRISVRQDNLGEEFVLFSYPSQILFESDLLSPILS